MKTFYQDIILAKIELIFPLKLFGMKIFLLFIALILFLLPGYTQKNPKFTYAIVSVNSNYDKWNKKTWYNINAESIARYSPEITSLVKYNDEKGAINPLATFYYERKDTTSPYFNYFLSAVEAIQFLVDNQWQLVTVNNVIASDYDNVSGPDSKYIPITKVTSRPVYYFKKEVL